MARGQNRHVDSLTTLASSLIEEVPWLIKVEVVEEPSIDARVGVSIVAIFKPYWMDPIINFLAKDRLPADAREADRVCHIVAWYWLLANYKLYQRSFGGPYLQCLHSCKVEGFLTELHEGVCDGHVGGHSLAHQAMSQGFWWPQMHKDATEHVQRCELCQKHAPLIHQSAGSLNPISSHWPFA